MKRQFVIIVGNVVDGLQLYGPFQDASEANEYGDLEFPGADWIVATLEDPEA
jgi:hypothetical protein